MLYSITQNPSIPSHLLILVGNKTVMKLWLHIVFESPDHKNRLHKDSISFKHPLGRQKAVNQKFTRLYITDDINWSLPAKERHLTVQLLSFALILSVRGEYSDFLSFLCISGRPKYLMGREPLWKPKISRASVSSGFSPAKNKYVLSNSIITSSAKAR